MLLKIIKSLSLNKAVSFSSLTDKEIAGYLTELPNQPRIVKYEFTDSGEKPSVKIKAVSDKSAIRLKGNP